MKKNRLWRGVFLTPAVILFLLIFAVPLVIVFGTSLFEYKLMSPDIKFIGLQNYVQFFQDEQALQALSNTVVWILIQCSVHVGIGILLALILYKKPFGWKFVRTVYMIPNIICNAAMGMIFLNVFNPKFGIVNSVLRGIGLESVTRNWLMDNETAFAAVSIIWVIFAGYTTTLVLSEALSVDSSIIEAARVDGASDFQLDFWIMLPLLKKIIGTILVMGATYMLQMFDLIYITTNGGPGKQTTNLPLMLYNVFKTEHNYGYTNTIGVLIIVLGMICMFIINKTLKVNEDN
ncbi:carbohydrate ABC transporter permease [Ruminococcus gauvreauii]|uniref:Sugar ABC transporter permease n=1 Tax=Ruminococcus gauvreauii TaxID=438033 RepID=A0ABY5VCJ4_9FIRM|nr:sugar ABC transporter permease [Ruminococcus gauvreauii]UWP57896.1 sugar ABC transporter permease [Ruminococcus gauvreauii]